MIPTDPAERNATAAEYVIGTLRSAEHAEFEHALARDFVLRQDVYYWQDKLLPMTRMLTPVEPSPDVWRRIERGLTHAARSARATLVAGS